MALKIIQSLIERVKICKICWKNEKKLQELLRTNKGIKNNHHKTKQKTQSCFIQVMTHTMKNFADITK